MAEFEVLGEGRFLRLLRRHGWELVERVGVTRIAVVVAMTDDDELLLVEQYREPVRARVVELPAGLAGDEDGAECEPVEAAAHRELLEETGYEASAFEILTGGPPSAGLTSETVTFFRARGLRPVGAGGGVGDERIEVHCVPLAEVERWLEAREAAGRLIDPKVWVGLYFARS